MRGPEPRCLTNERPSECHTRGWGGLWGVLMTMVQAIVVMWRDKTHSSPLIQPEAGPRYGADTEILHRYPDCHLGL